MADPDASKPKEPPKPVHIGGESLVDRILPHIKKIIVAILIVAAVLTVIFVARAWKHRGQEKDTAKIADVIAVTQRAIVPPPPPAEGSGSGSAGSAAPAPKPVPADPKDTTYADSKERAKAVLDELAKQGVSAPTHSFAGAMQLQAGNFDQALAEYRAGETAAGIEGVMCREGIGLALEAKADAAKADAAARSKFYEEALAAYQKMQPDEKGPRRVYALYHQGRILALQSKHAEAKALFEKANELLATQPQHELRELVTKRLAALGAA